jgi:hypothetical protein
MATFDQMIDTILGIDYGQFYDSCERNYRDVLSYMNMVCLRFLTISLSTTTASSLSHPRGWVSDTLYYNSMQW